MLTTSVDYQDADGRRYVGHLASPDHPNGAGVVLAHNAPGIDAFERDVARRLAESGFVVFCADYIGDGRVLTLDEVHSHLAPAMADPRVIRPAITAALAVLLAQPNVDPGRIAVIGYCFGGAVALELARSGADVAAVACFHSSLPATHPQDDRNIRGKVLIQTGTADPMITADQRTVFSAHMDGAGCDWRMILYGGVEHAFTVPDAAAYGMPGLRYDQSADRRSWRAMLDLFSETIAPSTRI